MIGRFKGVEINGFFSATHEIIHNNGTINKKIVLFGEGKSKKGATKINSTHCHRVMNKAILFNASLYLIRNYLFYIVSSQ
jgi:hypothetical protein